jgi:hypothetical protein
MCTVDAWNMSTVSLSKASCPRRAEIFRQARMMVVQDGNGDNPAVMGQHITISTAGTHTPVLMKGGQ